MRIPFFIPPLGKEEAKAASDTILSGWLTFGKKTEEFEKNFANYIGAPHCVMVDNCTAALYLACEYAFRNLTTEERKQLIIGVPSFTCAATVLAPLHAGASARFIDLRDDNSFLMKESDEADMYIPVHYAGKHLEYSKTNNILVEDCAHRIVKDGFTGNLQAYSFYVTKNITTGEGGMIACTTESQANWFRKARLYGNANAIFKREKMYQMGEKFWWFESEFKGWKANPTDLAASIGLVQLQKIDKLNDERKRIAERYNKAFGLVEERFPWHIYPILVKERDKFMTYMRDNQIYCSVHFPPLHMMKAFKDVPYSSMEQTERVYDHVVSLPLYPYMTEEEQNIVISFVGTWIKKYGQA